MIRKIQKININTRFKGYNKITFYDKLLIISILIISILSYGIFSILNSNSNNRIVNIKQGDKILLQLPIDNVKKDGIYNFSFDGGVGAIEVRDNKVRMLPMDKVICPLEICSKTGWIDGGLKIIVCLPNRLIVSFSKVENNSVDGVAY